MISRTVLKLLRFIGVLPRFFTISGVKLLKSRVVALLASIVFVVLRLPNWSAVKVTELASV